MDYTAFDSTKPFLKGNLHAHSTVSDGRLTPSLLASCYKDHGYDFIAVTDHNVFSSYGRLEGLPIIAGMELSILWGGRRLKKAHHLLVLGEGSAYNHLERIAFPHFTDADVDFLAQTQKTIDFLKEHGYTVVYNHPFWSRTTDYDILPLRGLDMIEVYNHGSELLCDDGYDKASWHKFLDCGVHINAIATDDNHNWPPHDDSFGGWIMVNSASKDPQAILKDIVEGRFYSSTGAYIRNWGIKDGEAWIRCGQKSRIFLHHGPDISYSDPVFDAMEASFPIPEGESWLRFEVVDGNGGRAWTNPYWL